jgi:undecaprenyl-diphosphatase
MDLFVAILLGLIQGITEWIPVSSTGHLVFAQLILDLKPEENILFALVLHAATLASVTFFLRKELKRIIPAMFRDRLKLDEDGIRARRLGWFAVIATIPIAIAGIIESRFLKEIFSSALPTAVALLFTGLMLWVAETPSLRKERTAMGLRSALTIGLFQAVAVLPGISRSGSTISAGCYLGFRRDVLAIFSFLLSIPAIILALAYGFASLEEYQTDWTGTIVAAVVAAVTGILALKWLFKVIQKHRLRWFALYCWAAGLVAIALILMH